MYYRPLTNEVFTLHGEVRTVLWESASIILDSIITDDCLADVGVYPLIYEKPAVEPGQVAEPLTIELIDEAWTQLWDVRDATPEEKIEHVARLESARNQRRADIDRWRAEANASTFPHGDKQIACDALSRSDLDGVAHHIALFGKFPEGFPGGWKATDKTMLPLADVEAFRAMYASMTAQGTENFNHSQELKAQLAAASTPEEIATIQWSSPTLIAKEGS